MTSLHGTHNPSLIELLKRLALYLMPQPVLHLVFGISQDAPNYIEVLKPPGGLRGVALSAGKIKWVERNDLEDTQGFDRYPQVFCVWVRKLDQDSFVPLEHP